VKTILRALAAIFGGMILGSIFAIPVGLLIDLVTGQTPGAASAPGPVDQWGMTLPSAIYAIATGFLTGSFAGLIFRRNGKLIGALTAVVPPAIVVSLVLLLSLRIHSVYLGPANNKSILSWAGLGFFPAVVGGTYGARFPLRSVAQVLNFTGFALLFVFALWGFVISLGIVNKVAGFWGVVVGLTVAPVTLAAAPWYALVAWGSWYPLLICYGGTVLSGLMLWVASKVKPASGLLAPRG